MMMNGQIEDQPVDAGEVALVELTPDQLAAQKDADEKAKSERDLMLDTLGLSLAGLRSDAMAAREASGIEEEWEEDEEHYEGIDDANRGERKSWRGKPPGAATGQTENPDAPTSTVFINITRPYVDAASARVSDMLLPTDDRSWAIKPTPIPELADMAKGKFSGPVLRQAAEQFPGNPTGAQDQLQTAVQQALAAMDAAKECSDRAQKRIEDWHIQSQYHGEVRKVIESATKIGTGILKGPVPMKKRAVAFVDGALVLKEDIQPGSVCISPWNFYPDGACGENIHNGAYTWERDDITDRGLLALIGSPGYLDDQILKVLEEGASKASKVAPQRPLPDGSNPDKSGAYEIWYFHGLLKREDMEACGCELPAEGYVSVPAQVTMVNNRVIKAVLNPLDTGDLPYDVMLWQKRAGSWTGIGVSRQIRTPQEIVVGAGRNLMDNAGRAGGPQLVVQQGVVVPHNGVYEVTPWKVWLADESADMQHVDKAFRFVVIPILQQELMAIIQLGLKLAEDVTGLPMLLQGQVGSAPDTLGGQQLANNNASTVLRRIARIFDDSITEPHIRRYYAYLLTYGEDNEKGDFQIDARGSSALVQRDVENQSVGEMGKIVANPIFGLDPKKWAEEWLKGRHLDPKRFKYDDKEWEKVVTNMTQHQDPRVAVAQLRAQVDEKLLGLEQQFQATENGKDRQAEAALALIDERMKTADIQSGERKLLESIKATLGETLIRVNAVAAQQESGHAVDLHKHHNPVAKVEPPGLAPAGQAAFR